MQVADHEQTQGRPKPRPHTSACTHGEGHLALELDFVLFFYTEPLLLTKPGKEGLLAGLRQKRT